MEKDIRKILEELFVLIGIDCDIVIKEEKSEDGKVYEVELDPGESAGLFIGRGGMTLSSLQSFVAIAIKQKTGEWVRIILDVAGWSKKQNSRLEELAKQTAERVRETGEEQRLYNLNGQQRRVVHMVLSSESDIETTSEGEGVDRYLIVRLRAK